VSEPAATLFLGFGDAMRGDDGVGPWLVAALGARGCDARHLRDGADLVALVEGRAAVALLDATRGAGPPGTLTARDLAQAPVPAAARGASSHLFGLAAGVETARALGLLPPDAHFYGVEGAAFGFGDGLSPAVAAQAQALTARLSPAG
jgi:hydrogenase maturation protease